MGIDPGTINIGIAIYYVDIQNPEYPIMDIEAFTINLVKSLYYDITKANIHGNRVARLVALESEIARIVNTYKPIKVGCEEAYYHASTPAAFGPLVEAIMVIKNVCYDYDEDLIVDTYKPSYIKKVVGSRGGAKKDEVKETVLDLLKNELYLSVDRYMGLDDHSIDAIAIGYTEYLEYFNGEKSCLVL